MRPPIKGGAKSHNSPPSPEFSGILALEERAKDVMTESRIPIRNFSVFVIHKFLRLSRSLSVLNDHGNNQYHKGERNGRYKYQHCITKF
ncbi:hypothetical protein [uncultured Roseivirga sp.]|uniref:hypothetical protein n=1 Tax=uncultured Roseivirga sp. TaxID=543088 RepID=UPI002590E209|nr:hypothetical protein [uncultured Roseivirga sp.]MEC7752545.1 hypothetical protein [Bacteroidota bacterium]